MFLYPFAFDPAFLIIFHAFFFWFCTIFSEEASWFFYFYCVLFHVCGLCVRISVENIVKWAMIWDFQQCSMCDQQRLRPACAYAQTDQSLCWSREYYISVKLLTEHRLEFLSLKGGCTDSSESTLVKMPHSCLFVLWLQVQIQRGDRGSGPPGKLQVI